MERFYVDSEWVRDLYTGVGEGGDPYGKTVIDITFYTENGRGIVAYWNTDGGTCYHRKHFTYKDLDIDIVQYIADGGDIFKKIADIINEYFKDYERDESDLPF